MKINRRTLFAALLTLILPKYKRTIKLSNGRIFWAIKTIKPCGIIGIGQRTGGIEPIYGLQTIGFAIIGDKRILRAKDFNQ